MNVPLVIETVAPARSRLSGSDTETLPDNATAACPAVKVTLAATLLKVGGLCTAVMVTVVVAAVLRLFELPPLLSIQVTRRVAAEP